MQNAHAVWPEIAGDALATVSAQSAGLPRHGVEPRLAFIDLSRAVATLMMIQGHTLDVLLLPVYRTTAGFHVWSFARGLTSCLFLFLSGFVFAVATRRRWTQNATGLRASSQRIRRFVLFVGLGYLLHAPAGNVFRLWSLGSEAWRGFGAVDILQCIGVSLCGLQALVVVTRTPRRFGVAAIVTCIAVVLLTPLVWNAEAVERLPTAMFSYFSPRRGSLFPLFPWAGYMLLGAALGARYQAGSGAIVFANRLLIPSAVVLIVTSVVCSALPFQPVGLTDFWSNSPNLFFLRAGLVLLVVALIAHVTRFVSAGDRVVRSLAQETLLVYVVHVCLVYGSPWNPGLRQMYGPTLGLAPALGGVAALWIAMALMATVRNTVRGNHPRVTNWRRRRRRAGPPAVSATSRCP